jgi:hypothetical protein
LDGWRLDESIDEGRERWMEARWIDEGMDGVLKNIKIGDYILYAKNTYEGGRKKIYLRKFQVEGRKR